MFNIQSFLILDHSTLMNWIIDYAFEMLESFIILQVAARPACSGNFLMNKLPSSPNRSFTELQQQKNLRFSHQGYLELSKGRSKKTAIMVLYAHDRAQVSTNQLHPTQALVGLLGNFLTHCFHHTKSSKWNARNSYRDEFLYWWWL